MTTPTSQSENYDIVILGSGEAGKFIARTLAKKGKKAVVIERKWIGGSCPNIACLPSKNIIHSQGGFLFLPQRGIRDPQGERPH